MNRSAVNRDVDTNCPACLGLPEWQWGTLTYSNDFCHQHVEYRYQPLNEPTDEEWAAAAAKRYEQLGLLAYELDLRLYLPRRLWRCTACGELAVDIVRHEHNDCAVLGWDAQPYAQAPTNPWDTDDFAAPRFEGTRRQSH